MNILFTGIGGPTPLGIARSVLLEWPSAKCIGVDASQYATHHYQSDIFTKTYKIPVASDPNYWVSITNIIESENIDFAFIIPETETLIWSDYASKNEIPCKAFFPGKRLAEICFDKYLVAIELYSLGLTPKTIEIKSEDHTGLNFPFWIRIKSGAGALGALKITSLKDLSMWLSLHSDKTNFIASEYLPGRNYACKLLFFRGKLVQHASAERIDYLLSAAAPSGISGMCARGRLLNRPDLVEKSEIALKHLSKKSEIKTHGMFTVDFKENSEGIPLITEINIRHVSFNHAFALGGINFPVTTLKLHNGDEAENNLRTTFDQEKYFIRGVDAPLRLIDNLI